MVVYVTIRFFRTLVSSSTGLGNTMNTVKIDDKINKIYWFLLGQTAILVALILANLRLVDIV